MLKVRRIRLRRFKRDEGGVAAVEFAILALPFLLTLFAIIETALSFTAQQVMSNATDRLAREIRTGVINPSSLSKAAFEKRLCDSMSIMMPAGCPGLHFDVQSYSDYASVPKNVPYTYGGKVNTAGFGYSPGGPGTINSMRVIYEWPVATDLMKSRLSNLENGKILLYSSMTWRNEP